MGKFALHCKQTHLICNASSQHSIGLGAARPRVPIEQIAAILELEVERVRQVLAAAGQN